MAIQTLEERLEQYVPAIIESVGKRTSNIGSVLNIGQHVWDYNCEFKDEAYKDGKDIPLDSIFEFHDGSDTFYGVVNAEKAERLVKDKEKRWFDQVGKAPLEHYSKDAPKDYDQKKKDGKVIPVDITKKEKGGSAGHAAIAERTFLNYVIDVIEHTQHEDKNKVLDLLQSVRILYAGIDSDINGFDGYYEDSFGVLTHGEKNGLMIRPEDYDLPTNLIFEGEQKTVLQPISKTIKANNGQFPEYLSRTNVYGLGMIAIISPKHHYLLQECDKLFGKDMGDSSIVKAASFASSSLNKNRDYIMEQLLPKVDVLVQNKDEIRDMTGKDTYAGLKDIVKKIPKHEFTIYMSQDEKGIKARRYKDGALEDEATSNPYEPNLTMHHAGRKFTGAGDAGMGVSLIGHLLRLPLNYTIELANLVSQYRIDHASGIHDWAKEINEEIMEGSMPSINSYKIDPAR